MRAAISRFNWRAFFALLPVFWFVATPDYFLYFYFLFCLLVVFIGIRSMPSLKFKLDPFLLWLAGYFILVFILDLANGAQSLLYTANLLFDFGAIGIILLYDPGVNELLLLTLAGLATLHAFYLWHPSMYFTKHHTGPTWCAVVALGFLLLKRYKSAASALLVSCMFFTRASWVGLLCAAAPWYLYKNFRSSKMMRKTALALLMGGLLAAPIVIGKYYRDNLRLFKVTTQRSYFYQILMDDFSNRGMGMLLPASNIHSTEVLSVNLMKRPWLNSRDSNFRSYLTDFYHEDPLQLRGVQAAHSTYLEFLVNYGLVITFVILVSFLLLENERTWPIVTIFLIVIGFQPEFENLHLIVPIYLTYRLVYFGPQKTE